MSILFLVIVTRPAFGTLVSKLITKLARNVVRLVLVSFIDEILTELAQQLDGPQQQLQPSERLQLRQRCARPLWCKFC